MSKIVIKTDFKDGEKLFATQLNNNFKVIQEGINANESNLDAVIAEAEVRLEKELEKITADRGWDWNGGDRVTFYKGTTQQVEQQPIKNGQLLYNKDTGETALDDGGKRITTGSGNVVVVNEEEPTNPATTLWIEPEDLVDPDIIDVVNTMDGNDTDKAPSVMAVKNYVTNKNTYSTEEIKTDKLWIDGKPIYRKVITGNFNNTKNSQTFLVSEDCETYIGIETGVIQVEGSVFVPIPYTSSSGYYKIGCSLATNGYITIDPTQNGTNVQAFSVVVLYTKTTDEEVSE